MTFIIMYSEGVISVIRENLKYARVKARVLRNN